LQYQAVEAYREWLDQPYTLHLTTRLPHTSSTRKANMHLVRNVLAPLQKHLGIPLAGVSVITERKPFHAHTLLVSPSTTVDIRRVQDWVSSKSLRIDREPQFVRMFNLDDMRYDEEYLMDCTHDLSRTLCVTLHNSNTVSYVCKHLIKQDAALHFFNKGLFSSDSFCSRRAVSWTALSRA